MIGDGDGDRDDGGDDDDDDDGGDDDDDDDDDVMMMIGSQAMLSWKVGGHDIEGA